MPPEQIRGDRVDRRADVYSLAATLYEALALRPPCARCPNDISREDGGQPTLYACFAHGKLLAGGIAV
jgi:serine/threonine protein kinase